MFLSIYINAICKTILVCKFEKLYWYQAILLDLLFANFDQSMGVATVQILKHETLPFADGVESSTHS